MRYFELTREQWLAAPLEVVFTFFAEPCNLEAITPPWLHFALLPPLPTDLHEGARIFYRLRWRGIPLRWVTEIAEWQPPRRFVDVQQRGPYSLWHHTHEFEATKGGTRMRDTVRYALPLGVVGCIAHRLIVRRDLEAIFDYRSRAIEKWLPWVSPDIEQPR
jgi:ligand-binding SRPBCC domain-containing protein